MGVGGRWVVHRLIHPKFKKQKEGEGDIEYKGIGLLHCLSQ